MRRKKNRQPEYMEIPDIDIIDLDDMPEDSYIDEDSAAEDESYADEDSAAEDESYADEAPEEYDYDILPEDDIAAEEYMATEEFTIAEEFVIAGADDTAEEAFAEEQPAPEEDSPTRSSKNRTFGFVLLAVLMSIALFLLGFAVSGLLNRTDDGSQPSHSSSPDASSEDSSGQPSEDGQEDVQILDYMAAGPEVSGSPADDGETVIVALGNSVLSAHRDGESTLSQLIASAAGATVYDCSVADSYLCAESSVLSADLTPSDAFSFYWLVNAFCRGNNRYVYRDIFEKMGESLPEDGRLAYETLQALDFAKVDVIAIMYDGADYLAGHSAEGTDDIRSFSDNLALGISLIQRTFPHIRVIVMSPAYTYAIGTDGSFADSMTYSYGTHTLPEFVKAQYNVAASANVTFVDNLNGTISAQNAADYLIDQLHLNAQGRALLAERFCRALTYFDAPVTP